jgi:hypothetical protein
MTDLLTRLNNLASLLHISPERMLNLMLSTYEDRLDADKSISIANTERKDRRKNWSSARRRNHSEAMKQSWARRTAARKPGPKHLTPTHKAKLMAGLARYRMHKKLEAHAA